MISAALACVAAGLSVSLVAPWLGRRMQPGLSTRLLASASVTTAATTLWVAALALSTSLARIPVVARFGDWSPDVLQATNPVPVWVSVGCGAFAARAAFRVAQVLRRRRSELRELRPLLRESGMDGLLVVPEERCRAFAIPGRPGRIVVTTGLLRVLDPAERRALIAHERSHLDHRHSQWVAAADLAAAVNPALSATARAVGHTAERWADEDAALAVGSRAVVARALAKSALHAAASSTALSAVSPAAVLAAAQTYVPERVRALLGPAPARRLVPALIILVLATIAITMAVVTNSHTDALFDQAIASP